MLEAELDVVLEGLDGDARAIEEDLDALGGGCGERNAMVNEGEGIRTR